MSLLVPVCDAHPLRLAETLASIAAQGRAQPHVILCLDGEKAVFGPQVRKALAGLPGARVIGQVRAGEPAALNTLAECCTTALAMVLRPGQRLASGAVQRLLERWNALDQGIDALIVPETVSCRQDPLAHGHLPAALAARLDELRGETALLRSSVLRTVGYETVRRNGERIDWAFWLRFDAEGYRAAFLPETDLVSAGVPLPAPTTAALLGTQVMVRDIATPNPPG